MNTQSKTESKITISSRIPTHIIENIDNFAKDTQRSRSFHIKKALELYSNSIKKIPTKTPKIDLYDDEILLNDWEELGIEAWNE
jgi:predicted transcriptional regulator